MLNGSGCELEESNLIEAKAQKLLLQKVKSGPQPKITPMVEERNRLVFMHKDMQRSSERVMDSSQLFANTLHRKS